MQHSLFALVSGIINLSKVLAYQVHCEQTRLIKVEFQAIIVSLFLCWMHNHLFQDFNQTVSTSVAYKS